LNVGDAARLGVAWATNLYSAALDSPVVAYDSTLGQTLAYIGTESGDVEAVNVASGQIVWGAWLGSAVRSTPLVTGGAVFIATFSSPEIVKLNASTGAVDCRLVAPMPVEGTPVLGQGAGVGSTIYLGTNDATNENGPFLAMNTSNCALRWEFTGYPTFAGSWDAASFARDASGAPLVIFGTADPDSAVYALNATNGAEVWRYQTDNPSPGVFDVGAGAAISPPGKNGFVGGVAYVPNKYGVLSAIDLSNGSGIFTVDFNHLLNVTEGGRSTPALDGTDLAFGYNGGMIDLDALNGSVRWISRDASHTEVLSSPAITGPVGKQVVVAADIGGEVEAVSLANGSILYRYSTGSYITASPAICGENVLIASAGGILYDFAVGGGNRAPLPTTRITSPSNGGSLANPGGSLGVNGTASSPGGVAAVDVAVQSGGPTGSWWDAASGRWLSGPVDNPATLAAPGSNTTNWSFGFPVGSPGGAFTIYANALGSSGELDPTGASVGISVNYSAKGPHLVASESFVAPGSSVWVWGGGFGPLESVTLTLGATVLATPSTSSTGYLPRTLVHLPSTTPFGPASLRATGQTTGRAAAATIAVANGWDQAGYSPAHTDFEPFDPTLMRHVDAGDNTWLVPAWHFDSGAAIVAAPAISEGVAYVADESGNLTALDTTNGGGLWTWRTPSDAPINGSPAVDPTRALVFVGAEDGTLYALEDSTGRELWNVSIGGNLSAPTIASGMIYIASSHGSVEELWETNGTPAWSDDLGSGIAGAPAVDPVHHLVVVGEAGGTVAALNNATGQTSWTYATGGPVVAAAALSNGTVFIGSASGTFFALSESRGALQWSYHTRGAVNATAVISDYGPGRAWVVLVGSADGTLYELLASNGSMVFDLTLGSAVVGAAAATGVVLFSGVGAISGARTYTDLDVWKFRAGTGPMSPPVILDGAVYVGTSDGNLYAFTTFGQAPD
jgi:outer membrane protein assembly factor BamB